MKEFQKTALLGVLAATFSGAALSEPPADNNHTVKLAWDLPAPPAAPCAIRAYNKIPPNVIRREPNTDTFQTFAKTLSVTDPVTGKLPTTTSVVVRDFYAVTRPVSLFVLTALYPQQGQTCAQALANNAYQFSPESNMVFTSQELEFRCPKGASIDRDNDGMCDDFETNVTRSAVTSANSDGDELQDNWEYSMWEEYDPRAGETPCPNGKYPLKTQDCDNDGKSDKIELLDFHNKGGASGALDPRVANGLIP